MSQWVAGFSNIVKDEQDVNVKNCMLDYLSELMEDCQGAQAVLRVQIEGGKVK